MSEIEQLAVERLSTGDSELDRVLGGGIVPGSITLVGGHPGIGKSTLLLQVALAWRGICLYVSGEESGEQLKLRANRLGGSQDNCYVMAETNVERVVAQVAEVRPSLIIVDSIQTIFTSMLESAPGTVSQVRDCTTVLQRLAKETRIPVIIIGHITKEGTIAGPKVLEHIVDTVLQFEGDGHFVFRLLRTQKNRFGSTDELGIYEMLPTGLSVVSNPSQVLITHESTDAAGSAVGATLQGRRPLLIETQALVSNAVYGTPQRSTTGFDLRRLHMLLAVLEKRCGLFFGQSDVFLNLAGGLKVVDTALDLAVVIVLISSLEELTVPADACFAGEVALSGEIRSVNRLDQRILEAERMGFRKIYVSTLHAKHIDSKYDKITVCYVRDLSELYDHVFVS